MSKWTTYKYDLLSKAPAAAGVYVIYHGSELVYIGQSENLRKRLRYHELLGPSVRDDSSIKVKVCKKLGEWHMVQFRLLRRLRPRLNKEFITSPGLNKYTYDQSLIDRINKQLARGYRRAWIANNLNKAGHLDVNRRPWTEVSVGIVGGVKGEFS